MKDVGLDTRRLEELFAFKQGVQVPVEEQLFDYQTGYSRFIRIVDLTTSNEPYRYVRTPKKSHLISSEDLFMVRYGAAGVVGIGFEGVIANNLFRLIPTKDLCSKYFYYLFIRNKRKLDILSASSTMPALSFKDLKGLKVTFHIGIEKQMEIANTFTTVDQKINLLTKKKKALETYKKGLMQKIFSQELRFKREDGTDYPEWKTFKLSEVLIEHKKRSDGSEQVHSVSVHKGVVNQIEHLGRSFAAKDVSNYNKVLFGDIIYTKSPTGDFPYGIIKQSYAERAIVSPLYCVTSPVDINIGYLLNWFFESKINVHNYLHPIIQKGAKNTINITNTTFLSRSLTLPSDIAERQKIKDVYSSLNDNLRTLESEILKVTDFKKGLLQKMFV